MKKKYNQLDKEEYNENKDNQINIDSNAKNKRDNPFK